MTMQADPPRAKFIAVPAGSRRARWYGPPEVRWLRVICWITVIAVIILFALTVAVFANAVGAADSQAARLSGQLAALQARQAADAAQIAALQGQLGAVQASTAPLAADTSRCSTGSSGPAGSVTYYYWCSTRQTPKQAGR